MATKKKKPAAKTTPKTRAKVHAADEPRRVKQTPYKSLRLQKRIKHPVGLPNVWRISGRAGLTLWRSKRLFIGIIGIYGILNLILVQGFASSTDVGSIKTDVTQAIGGHAGQLASGVVAFAELVGSAGNSSSATAGAYQLFLFLLASLATIWAFRQLSNGSKLRIRDAYYLGLYPLVPFMLILAVICIQLIPLVLGVTIYQLVVANGIAVNGTETLVWALFAGLLALLSLYMITSSIFAAYIVTLPDMTPMKALRSARELVRYRRWTVLRKVLFLPILLLVVAAIITMPIILIVTPLAAWIFFILTMLAVAAVHGYLYTLYRELLNE